MLLDIMFTKQKEIKTFVIKWYQRSRKQRPFKAFGSFKEINCMNKSLLTDSVFLLSEPNRRMSDNISSFNFFKKTSILNKLFRNFRMSNARRNGLLFQFHRT